MADAVLNAEEESPYSMVIGKADLIIQGLTVGSIKLQYRLQPTVNLPISGWIDFPGGIFTADTFRTLFISEHDTMFRFLGYGNNSGVYVRIAGKGGYRDRLVYSLEFDHAHNSFYIGVF